MVNCGITGNNSTQEGGGLFNSRHTGTSNTATVGLHNCLIVSRS